ncbi:CDGSH iron-sulfur domain-containing protein [Rhodopseudomonas palustris]|nr:CDGSH iron-sulfur domain-containing protein [Rhodopseudomonas palustris]
MNATKKACRVVILKNGPFVVSGSVPLAVQTIRAGAGGGSEAWEQGDAFPVQEKYALCRCGRSGTMPFCDGTHAKIGFDGTETASREPYLGQATIFDGPTLQLTDLESLCAFARFCDPGGNVWNQVARTDEPEIRASFIRQVENCPAGRLAARDKATGELLENELPISIGLVEDPQQQCSGPIWLRGGIVFVAADGFEYEMRNRVTLCRCGRSSDKPFCDGTHASIKFRTDS